MAAIVTVSEAVAESGESSRLDVMQWTGDKVAVGVFVGDDAGA